MKIICLRKCIQMIFTRYMFYKTQKGVVEMRAKSNANFLFKYNFK